MSAAEPDLRPRPPGEARLLAALVVVQLVTVVDLTMLLPLGPDLLAPLGLDAARLPLIIAAGTLSAALAGLFGGGWLERAPRRQAMVGLLLALAAAASLAASAEGWVQVLVARLCAGAAGGQAGALGLVVLSESVSESRRGRAVGAVMAANGLAAIGGVPLGLWLAQSFGWRAPFGLITLGAVLAAIFAGGSLPAAPGRPSQGALFSPLAEPTARMALALVFVVTASSFLLNPNLSAFVQHNLGFPREHLAGLYAVAGAVALVTTQLTGWAVDRFGALRVGALAASVFCTVVLGVVVAEGALDVRLGFIVLLASLQARNVSVRALATRVPPPQERGRFMSLWSAAQQLGAAAGAMVSAAMLSSDPSGRLIGLPSVGLFSALLTIGAVPLLAVVHRSVVSRFEREGSRPLA